MEQTLEQLQADLGKARAQKARIDKMLRETDGWDPDELVVHRMYTVGTTWCGSTTLGAPKTNDPAKVTCPRCLAEMRLRE